MPVTGPIVSFLYDLGFDYESTFVAEGQEFIRGRVKVLVYTVNEITSFQSIATSNAMGFGFDGQIDVLIKVSVSYYFFMHELLTVFILKCYMYNVNLLAF
ncbi:unnamed protein product [Schistosoma curassoni]|uniref:Mediator of RNA polymerase II transcription subunit 18 n=1 Tax=Schistosoma curassoni TaxID=6186 RepID=A0A183L6B7_9TREM|nr:unnamed protein product [Schistosoma curassoni]